MDPAFILTALVKHKGKIAPAARELKCSRAHLHEQVSRTPDLAARLKEIRTVGTDAVKTALDALTIHPDEVGIRAMMHQEGPHAATLAVIIEKLAETTGIAKRKLADELSARKYARRLAALLPQEHHDHREKKVTPVAISHEHRLWLASKQRGTVPALLTGLTAWPVVDKEAETPALFHTSFLLPKSLHRKLKSEAHRQEVSVSALVRAVLDQAKASESAAPLSRAA